MPTASPTTVVPEFFCPFAEQLIRFHCDLYDEDERRFKRPINSKEDPRPASSSPLLNAVIDQLFDAFDAYSNRHLAITFESHRGIQLNYAVSDNICSVIEKAIEKAIEQVSAET